MKIKVKGIEIRNETILEAMRKASTFGTINIVLNPETDRFEFLTDDEYQLDYRHQGKKLLLTVKDNNTYRMPVDHWGYIEVDKKRLVKLIPYR